MRISMRSDFVSLTHGLFDEMGKPLPDPSKKKTGHPDVAQSKHFQQLAECSLYVRRKRVPCLDLRSAADLENVEPIFNVDAEDALRWPATARGAQVVFTRYADLRHSGFLSGPDLS